LTTQNTFHTKIRNKRSISRESNYQAICLPCLQFRNGEWGDG